MKKFSLFILFFSFLQFENAHSQSNFIGAGISLKFNGSVNNDVELGDVYNSLSFPFSFETWINADAFPPIWAGIFSSDNNLSNYYGCWIRMSATGTVEIEFGNSFGAGIQ